MNCTSCNADTVACWYQDDSDILHFFHLWLDFLQNTTCEKSFLAWQRPFHCDPHKYTCHGDTPIYLAKYERYIKQVKIDILTLLADFNSSTAQGSWLEKGGTFGPMNHLQITKAQNASWSVCHAKSDLQLQWYEFHYCNFFLNTNIPWDSLPKNSSKSENFQDLNDGRSSLPLGNEPSPRFWTEIFKGSMGNMPQDPAVFLEVINYIQLPKTNNGKSPCSIGNTSSNGGCSLPGYCYFSGEYCTRMFNY